MKRRRARKRPIAASLADRIREEREAAGITRQRLADDLGLHVTSVCRIENGGMGVTADLAREIATVLGIGIAQLYGEPEIKAS